MLPLRQEKTASRKPAKEDLHFQIQFFEGVSQRDPKYVEALQVLGDAYTKTGQWEKGLKIDLRLARLCPDSPLVFYNLACSYSMLQKLDPAFAALERAIQLGYRDGKWLNEDPDLANLRKDSRFAALQAVLR